MELTELIGRIDALKGEIDAMRPIDPDTLGRIMQKLRLDWNFHSSNIEGNSLTYGETKALLLHGLTADGKPIKDHFEIQGHNEAIRTLEDIVAQREPLTEHMIRSLHQVILGEPYQIPARTSEGGTTQRSVTPGRYKQEPNHVLTVTGETFYFTSPENTPVEMEELMRWYAVAMGDPDLHPLVIAATFHYKFIRIHPFDDGNGRIARLLMNFVLMIAGYPPAIIRTEEKESYYRALRQADGDDIETFIIYVGERLLRSLDLYLRGARGEDIEEMDDVDKEIALFKAQIAAREDEAPRTKRSPDALRTLVERAIIPLIDVVIERLSQFDELFLERDFLVEGYVTHRGGLSRRVREPGTLQSLQSQASEISESNRAYQSSSEIHSKLLALVSNTRGIDRLEFSYRWGGFKHGGTAAFRYDETLQILFGDYTYTINQGYPDRTPITKLYHQNLSVEEMEQIARELAKEVLRDLKQRREMLDKQ